MYSANKLADYFYYDESSPSCLRWKVDVMCGEYRSKTVAHKGDPVGSWSQSSNSDDARSGAWVTSLHRKKQKVHRIIYQLFHDDLDEHHVIDHINGDAKDNRISNLRMVSRSVNMRNIKKRRDNQSGVTGVRLYHRKGRSDCVESEWVDGEGRRVSRCFSISRHGKEGAWMKAVAAREAGLHAAGDYSHSHGNRI